MQKKGDRRIGAAVLTALALLDLVLWYSVVSIRSTPVTRIHFLDVGQGDSTLITLPSEIQILIDAGPPRSATRPLSRVMRREDRYIDLAILTHPELDHMGGFRELLDRYSFGAFLWNGRTDAGAQEEWRELTDALRERGIPMLTIHAGNRITAADATAQFFSPTRTWIQSAALNDTGLVMHFENSDVRALFTADIDSEVEADLVRNNVPNAEILKVAHHGSKYSSSELFLRAVAPRVAFISSGKENRYGHPTREAIMRIKNSGAQIFRTDQNGTVRVVIEEGKLKVFTEK